MGIDIVDVVKQRGREDPRTYLGRGRLDEVGDVLRSAPHGHAWHGVDLVLMHTNATPRQLVATSTVLGVEVWDRVRLLLALFTAHAASVEARTQVRIARLRSDRTVLRELISQETTGERAGYGGAGATGATEVLVALGREIEGLRKRLQRHARAQSERRRQRTRSGARTVGLAGYTNAGKSSLFRALSGKSVLVEDRLFSTLETTVGRMEASPRVLLADTIGFIDALPSETLEAFRATLAEALECDLLLLMADASDDGDELLRRLNTSIREVQDRLDEDDVEVMVVLTKIDLIDNQQRKPSRTWWPTSACSTPTSCPRTREKAWWPCATPSSRTSTGLPACFGLLHPTKAGGPSRPWKTPFGTPVWCWNAEPARRRWTCCCGATVQICNA